MIQCLLIIFNLIFMTGCVTPTINSKNSPSIDSEFKENEVVATDLSFNSDTGEINYALPVPAMVRICVGLRKGGPMLTHVLDWEFRDQGVHKEIWNGKANGGNLDFRKKADLMLVLKAVSLKKGNMNLNLKKSPQFKVEFPESKAQSKEGFAIVNGKEPIRVSIDKETYKWLSNVRFETALYIDHLFLIEEEEGINPFTFYLDTNSFYEGVHTITVMITTNTGETGTLSVEIEIKNK